MKADDGLSRHSRISFTVAVFLSALCAGERQYLNILCDGDFCTHVIASTGNASSYTLIVGVRLQSACMNLSFIPRPYPYNEQSLTTACGSKH
eukprot:6196300-Pleurochrysis_carterae.AAC.4